MKVDNVLAGKIRPAQSYATIGAFEVPESTPADLALASKAARAQKPRPLDEIVHGLGEIGRRGTWISDDDLRTIASATGAPIYFLRRSIARTNAWLAQLSVYVARFGKTHDASIIGPELVHRGGVPTAIILAGDSSAMPAQTITHALIANARAIVKPSNAEPLSTFRFAQALLAEGLPCPQLVHLRSSSDEGKAAIRALIASAAQSVVYGEDRTVADIYGPLGFLPAHQALPFWSGRSGVIVLPDADPTHAAKIVLEGVAYDRGNKCISTKKAFVPVAHREAFVRAIASAADAIPRGTSLDDNAQLAGLHDGARRAAHDACAGSEVLYDRDVVIAAVRSDESPLLREELPYPLLGVRFYAPDEDPIALANASVAHAPTKRALVMSVVGDRDYPRAVAELAAYKVLHDVSTTTIDLDAMHQGGHLFLQLMRTGDHVPA